MNRPLYNQLVAHYELIEGRDWRSETNLITAILRKHESRSIVDLGCGTGYHVRALAKRGFHATGIDISEQNIRFARKEAKRERVHPHFHVDSYYAYRPDEEFDAALCLNWSIPVTDDGLKQFLDNTNSLLRGGGVLIFDFERISEIVWKDVGKSMMDSWEHGKELVVRVSVGEIVSNVLYSRDVYAIYPKNSNPKLPNEKARYKAARRSDLVRVYVDRSYVRFFSIPEIRRFSKHSGFRLSDNLALPRNRYRRNYAVLRKISQKS
jgi:SAM-dependent methyltransferase